MTPQPSQMTHLWCLEKKLKPSHQGHLINVNGVHMAATKSCHYVADSRHLAWWGPAGQAVEENMNVLQTGSEGGGCVEPGGYLLVSRQRGLSEVMLLNVGWCCHFAVIFLFIKQAGVLIRGKVWFIRLIFQRLCSSLAYVWICGYYDHVFTDYYLSNALMKLGRASPPTEQPHDRSWWAVNSHQVGAGNQKCTRLMCGDVTLALRAQVITFPTMLGSAERSGLENTSKGRRIKDLWLQWQWPVRRWTLSPRIPA